MTQESSITCSNTLAVTSHRIFPDELNEHGTVFGGVTLNLVDREAFLAAMHVARETVVTAKMDHVNFIKPFQLHDSMTLQAYVTGIGHRSIEVFAKIIGEKLETGERFLGFTCFATFVIENPNATVKFKQIISETKEQKSMCSGYQERLSARKIERDHLKFLNKEITIDEPWTK